MNMRIKVKRVKKIKFGYIGMNAPAAHAHHIPYHNGRRTIEVLKSLHGGRLKRTIKHERVELELMNKGMSYHKAHKIALKEEGK